MNENENENEMSPAWLLYVWSMSSFVGVLQYDTWEEARQQAKVIEDASQHLHDAERVVLEDDTGEIISAQAGAITFRLCNAYADKKSEAHLNAIEADAKAQAGAAGKEVT